MNSVKQITYSFNFHQQRNSVDHKHFHGCEKFFTARSKKAVKIKKAENLDKSMVFGVFAGVSGGIRTHGLSLRSSPDTTSGSDI